MKKKYFLKIYVKHKILAFAVVECNEEVLLNITKQLIQTASKFIKISSIIINKEEIRYVRIISKRKR